MERMAIPTNPWGEIMRIYGAAGANTTAAACRFSAADGFAGAGETPFVDFLWVEYYRHLTPRSWDITPMLQYTHRKFTGTALQWGHFEHPIGK